MYATSQPDDRIEILREQRRTLATRIRSLLEQLDKLELEFEATQQELLRASGGHMGPRMGPPAA